MRWLGVQWTGMCRSELAEWRPCVSRAVLSVSLSHTHPIAELVMPQTHSAAYALSTSCALLMNTSHTAM